MFERCDETVYRGHYAMRLQCDGNLAFVKLDPATGQWPLKKIMSVSGTRGANGWGKDGVMFKKEELTMVM